MGRPKRHTIWVSAAFAAALTHSSVSRAAVRLHSPARRGSMAFSCPCTTLQPTAKQDSLGPPMLALLPHCRDVVTMSFKCPAEPTYATGAARQSTSGARKSFTVSFQKKIFIVNRGLHNR